MKQAFRTLKSLNKGIVIFLLILLSPDIRSQAGETGWHADTLVTTGTDLIYLLYVPENYSDTAKLPLIVSLHGGKGISNMEIAIRNTVQFGIYPVLPDSIHKAEHPCLILAPLRVETAWIKSPGSNNSWGGHPPITDYKTFHPLVELIDSITQSYRIDRNRIYLTGYSAGGMGACAFLAENPDYFAAALLLHGWAWMNTENEMNSLRHLPVWNHHGENDMDLWTIRSREEYQKYEARGLPVVYPRLQKYVNQKPPANLRQNILTQDIDYIYSEYRNEDHGITDVVYVDTLVYDWLFSKRKRTRNIISFLSDTSCVRLQPEHTLRLSCEVDTLQMALHFSADLGYSWDSIGWYPSSADSITFITGQLRDTPKGQFRIQLLDHNGHIIGTDYSGYYVVDNAEDYIPDLKHYISSVTYKGTSQHPAYITRIKCMLHGHDVETDTLNLDIWFKTDNAYEYQLLQSRQIAASMEDHSLHFSFDTLAIGTYARMKFVLSDGTHSVSDSTERFYLLKYEETDLWVWPEEMTIGVGDTAYLNYGIYPTIEADRIESVGSRNEEIASLTGHVVRGNFAGKTNLYYEALADDGFFTDSCLVTVNPLYSLQVDKEDISCHGISDGSISVRISEEGEFFYLWSNGNSTSSLTDLPPGSYTVTVSDTTGPVQAHTFIVRDPGPLQVEFLTTPSCHGDTSGSTSAGISGGTKPYRYLWNTNDTIAALRDVSPGIYSVQVTDKNGCTLTASDTITEDPEVLTGIIIGPANPVRNVIYTFKVEQHTSAISKWTVNGGDIRSGQDSDSIQVRWRTTGPGWVSVVGSNENGCMGDTVVMELPTYINEAKVHGFHIYPNPANEKITIESNLVMPLQIRVTSMKGRLMYIADPEITPHRIDLSQFRSGVYFITIRSKDSVITRKFIKL